MSSDRYCRQISLIGEANQLKLANASILVVGAGGIGSPLLLYLASAGVGRLGFIDHDSVTISNLHRQILFSENDIGLLKSAITYDRLKSLNSEIELQEYNSKLTLENARSILSEYDLIIDGSDNFKTRYLVNDICCQLNKPFLSASIFQNKIQINFFDIRQGCYRCIFPEPPPPFLMNNCSDAGVLGATTGVAGSMTATLAMKYFIDQSSMPILKIITFDNSNFKTDQLPFSQRSNCKGCHHKSISWPTENLIKHFKKLNYQIIKSLILEKTRRSQVMLT